MLVVSPPVVGCHPLLGSRKSAGQGRRCRARRTAATLSAVADKSGQRASWHKVDTSDQVSVEQFFENVEPVDGLFTTAATYVTGPMSELSISDAATAFDSKFWGQYRVVNTASPMLSADASIVLMSGAAGARPAGMAPAYSAVNAAIEGLARGLAVELAPVRVNAVAPGTVIYLLINSATTGSTLYPDGEIPSAKSHVS
jgi:NAD(P)-dependent dehydrogenase (short-subunit alcohol dehydrogenase family)